MKWPVARWRYDEALSRIQFYRERIAQQDETIKKHLAQDLATLERAHHAEDRADKMLDIIVSMKQRGFAPVPHRTPTLPNVPYRGTDLAVREKFVKQFSEEPGVTPEQAQLAADQLMAELQ